MSGAPRRETRQHGEAAAPPDGDGDTVRRVRAIFDPSPRTELAGAAEFLYSLLHVSGTAAGAEPADRGTSAGSVPSPRFRPATELPGSGHATR